MEAAFKFGSEKDRVDLHIVPANNSAYYSSLVQSYFQKSSAFPFELVTPLANGELIHTICESKYYNPEERSKLSSILLEQYSRLPEAYRLSTESPVYQNIVALSDAKTVTVTTGQQIHIFMGPLFVWYKIMSCINQAKKYSRQQPEHTVVPVFWMATEDHDFEEIKSTTLYGTEYQWDIESSGAVGRLSPASLLPLVDELSNRLDATKENQEFIKICRDAYQLCTTYADANRLIYHCYFEKYGLIVIDPDEAQFKAKMLPIIADDLTNHLPSSLIDESISKMKAAGIKAPINTRSINFFHLEATARSRIIEVDSDHIQIAEGKVISKTEYLSQAAAQPDKLSPNALLRPLYQQLLLPNIAYVCGTSEFVYWLELKLLHDSYQVTYPELVIRDSILISSEKLFLKISRNLPDLNLIFESNNDLKSGLIHNSQNEITQKLLLLESIKSNLIKISQDSVLQDVNSKLGRNIIKQMHKIVDGVEKLSKEWIEAASEGDNEINLQLKSVSKVLGASNDKERNTFIINNLSDILKLDFLNVFETISNNESKNIYFAVLK